jgi:hypothetical protein
MASPGTRIERIQFHKSFDTRNKPREDITTNTCVCRRVKHDLRSCSIYENTISPNFAIVSDLCCLALILSNYTAVKIDATEAATIAATIAIMIVTGSNLFALSG